MPATEESNSRTLVICGTSSALAGADIFNPNFWSGISKGIVESCWTEYSVLHNCTSQITLMCADSARLCSDHVITINQQWHQAKFDIEKIAVFCPVPDLHIRIEAYFSAVKSLIDLLVQMLSSEKIVNCSIDGFHRLRGIYGGTVTNALNNNVGASRKEIASKILSLINEHKYRWMDQAIKARDLLIHPQTSKRQLMFQLELAENANGLSCVKVNPPVVGSEYIDQYSKRILETIREFSLSFLGTLRGEKLT